MSIYRTVFINTLFLCYVSDNVLLPFIISIFFSFGKACFLKDFAQQSPNNKLTITSCFTKRHVKHMIHLKSLKRPQAKCDMCPVIYIFIFDIAFYLFIYLFWKESLSNARRNSYTTSGFGKPENMNVINEILINHRSSWCAI